MALASDVTTGSPLAPGPTICACSDGESRYCRNSAQAWAWAWVPVQEKPSPPPRTAVCEPAEPGVCGNGNQPSSLLRLLLVETPSMTDGSQSPWSSIAALPEETMPAELPAPGWEEVPRKPVWNGLVFRNAAMFVLAVAKQEALKFSLLMAEVTVACGQSRSAKYSHQNASGQRSLLPTAIGA